MRLFIILFLIGRGQGVFAQAREHAKFFSRDVGFSLFTDFGISPVSGSHVSGKSDNYNTHFAVASVTYRLRYAFWEAPESQFRSLSVCVPASLGFSIVVYQPDASGGGFGNLTIPFFVQYHMGCGAKKTMDLEKYSPPIGFTLGAGMSMHYVPVIYLNLGNNNPDSDPARFWIMPAINMGLTYLRNKRPSEINLQVGYLPAQRFSNGTTEEHITPLCAKLSFIRYLNYYYRDPAKNRPGVADDE